jgi:hypothetical protein
MWLISSPIADKAIGAFLGAGGCWAIEGEINKVKAATINKIRIYFYPYLYSAGFILAA